MSLLSTRIWSDHEIDILNEYINNKLQQPEMIAEKIERSKNMEKGKKIQKTLKNVEKFINENEAIIYGGLAMNVYLPDELKFYDENTIPDYDFFILNTLKKARELTDLLKSKGGQFVEMKSALHEGTYKVFENFEAVADLTEINSKEYNILKKGSVSLKINNYKVNVAPVDFIKAAAYLELCLPLGSSFRWTKVYKRLMLLENAYPITVEDKTQAVIDLQKYIETRSVNLDQYKKIYTFIKKYVKLNEKIYVGIEAIKYYLKNISNEYDVLSNIENNQLEILDIDHENTLKDIESKLRAFKIDYVVKIFSDFSSFVPKKHVIYIRKNKESKYEKLISIYQADIHCFAYLPKKQMCSIFFLMYIYYFKQVVEYDPLLDNVIFLLKQMMSEVEIFEKYLTSFTDICYGNEISPTNIKKNIWQKEKTLQFYRP